MSNNEFILTGLYDDYYCYMRKKRIYVSDKLKRDLGKDNWVELLKEFVGYFTIHRYNGIAIDSLYDEMVELFPHLISKDIINQSDQLLHAFEILRLARIENKKSKIMGDLQ